MTIDRTAAQEEAPTLTISFSTGDAGATSTTATTPSSADATPAPERTERVTLTDRTSDEILQTLLRVTKAMPVVATPEETEELQSLEEARLRSLREGEISLKVREKKKREEALLAQARGEIASQAA